MSGGLQNRPHWLHWQAQPSDISGCVHLARPAPLQPTLPLSSPRVPVLSLLDALHAQGWSGREEMVMHVQALYKAYDARSVSSKRAYLQCLLTLPKILALVGEFPSGEPIAFYELLLKGKAVLAGRAAKEYRALLADEEGDLVELAALAAEEAPTQAPAPTMLMDKPPAPIADDECSIYADSDGCAADVAPQARSADSLAGARLGGADDEICVGDEGAHSAGLALRDLPAGVHWPERVLGQRLRMVRGRKGGGWSYEPRLSVTCSNPAHEGCSKSRSAAMDTSVFGHLAPVYFLGAWLQRSEEMTMAQHKRYLPDRAAVRAFADGYHE